MNKQSVISLLRKAKQPLSQSCGVKQLGLFGSTVRESNTESSDVDILIDFEDDKETYSNFLLKKCSGNPNRTLRLISLLV